jgi:hypothetical protein
MSDEDPYVVDVEKARRVMTRVETFHLLHHVRMALHALVFASRDLRAGNLDSADARLDEAVEFVEELSKEMGQLVFKGEADG